MTFRADSPTVAKVTPSPSHDARDARIDILLLHYTGMPTAEEALARLTDKESKVSSHYFVHEDGRIEQLVPEARRAWHAGISSWRARAACNDYSVGIELEGTDDLPYASAQYLMLARLARALRRRYPITDMVGHSDVAPGRKSDPGATFDWPKLGRLLGATPTGGRAD